MEEQVVGIFLAHMLSLIAVARDSIYERIYTGIFIFESVSPQNLCGLSYHLTDQT